MLRGRGIINMRVEGIQETNAFEWVRLYEDKKFIGENFFKIVNIARLYV